jgi:RimJ/RimL family protein N-acetyltransferase
MIFESERLSFRLIEQGDLDDLFNNIWGNNETMRFCGGVISKEKISHIIEHNLSQYNTYGNAVFEVMKNDKLLGICGGKLDEDDRFMLSWLFTFQKNTRIKDMVKRL